MQYTLIPFHASSFGFRIAFCLKPMKKMACAQKSSFSVFIYWNTVGHNIFARNLLQANHKVNFLRILFLRICVFFCIILCYYFNQAHHIFAIYWKIAKFAKIRCTRKYLVLQLPRLFLFINLSYLYLKVFYIFFAAAFLSLNYCLKKKVREYYHNL